MILGMMLRMTVWMKFRMTLRMKFRMTLRMKLRMTLRMMLRMMPRITYKRAHSSESMLIREHAHQRAWLSKSVLIKGHSHHAHQVVPSELLNTSSCLVILIKYIERSGIICSYVDIFYHFSSHLNRISIIPRQRRVLPSSLHSNPKHYVKLCCPSGELANWIEMICYHSVDVYSKDLFCSVNPF